MVNPFISTADTTTAIVLISIMILSFGVLLLATFEFRSIMRARRNFLAAIGYRDSLRSYFWQRVVLIFYIVSVTIISVGFMFLYLFRPRIF